MSVDLDPEKSLKKLEIAKRRTVYTLDTFQESWVLTFQRFFPLFGAWIVTVAGPVTLLVVGVCLGVGVDFLVFHAEKASWATLAGLLVPGALIGWLYSGANYVYLKIARRIPIRFSDFLRPIPQAINGLIVLVITTSLVSLGLLFFVIPGALLFLRWQLAPFYIVDRNYGPIKALKQSWHDTEMVFKSLGILDLMFWGMTFLTTGLVFGLPLCNMALSVAGAIVYSRWLTDDQCPDLPKLELDEEVQVTNQIPKSD